MAEKPYPGLHDQVRVKLATPDFLNTLEGEIIRKLSAEWYVTSIGFLKIGLVSSYRYALIKPVEVYQEMFNFERELVVVFSHYDSFEPRTLDAFDEVARMYQPMRIDKICNVLVSKDENIEDKIRDILSKSQQSQVIVPFRYRELISSNDSYLQRNRFKSYFYSRDLFAFESPLRNDLYFFGRTDLINGIVNRHMSMENSGLFGLRKSGKTSIVFGIERNLQTRGESCVVIDCEDPSFHARRWNACLHYIIRRIVDKYGLKIEMPSEDKYNEREASLLFERDIIRISKALEGKSVLIIFDEIENITFDKSPSQHWENGLDFVFFWQAIRAVFQRNTGVFTFLIVGTNPMCVERPTILDKDNPIFRLVPFEYIDRFDVPQTREMTRRLGRLMGLKFEETVYAKLTDDYGGHPFLMRHACSMVHKMSSQSRPVDIGRIQYEKARNSFDQSNDDYIAMLLQVLEQFYRDEYDMLRLLALDDKDFYELAADNPGYVNHLIGYGIIAKSGEHYDFRIDSVKNYLIRKNKYRNKLATNEERLQEISARRNDIEPKLRQIIRNHLLAAHGENGAKNAFLNIMGQQRKDKYYALAYFDLFNPNKVVIYFDDLRKIILGQWKVFENIFGKDRPTFDQRMSMLNNIGRSDAHAKVVDEDDLAFLRVCMNWLEQHVKRMD